MQEHSLADLCASGGITVVLCCVTVPVASCRWAPMSYGSHGGCARPGQPGVFTQVSKYLDYINSCISERCAALPPSLLWLLLTADSFFCNKALMHQLPCVLHQFKLHSSIQRRYFLYTADTTHLEVTSRSPQQEV